MLFNWARYRICKLLNKTHIRLLLVQLTEACDSRCCMCKTWELASPKSMNLKDFRKFFKNSQLSGLRSMCLMGGETFLYPHLVEAVNIVAGKHGNAELFMTSNCLKPDKILETAVKINAIMPISFGVSVDGISKTHDRIRGVEGAFEKVIYVLDGLRKRGIKTAISFTIQPENFDQIVDVYEFGKKHGVSSFSCRPASTGNYFYNMEDALDLTEEQKKKVIEQLRQIDYASHYLIYGVEQFLKGNRLFPCGAGYFHCFVKPDMSVLPCTHCPEDWVMGNLRDFDFNLERLLNSEQAKTVRRIKVDKCVACINDVEYCATYGMEQFKVALWLLKRAILRKGLYNLRWFITQFSRK